MIPGDDIREGDEVEVYVGTWVPGVVVRRDRALGAVVRYAWAVRLTDGRVKFFDWIDIRKVAS